MKYVNANDVLPEELLLIIQKYIASRIHIK